MGSRVSWPVNPSGPSFALSCRTLGTGHRPRLLRIMTSFAALGRVLASSRPQIRRVSGVLIGSCSHFHVFFWALPDRAPLVWAERPPSCACFARPWYSISSPLARFVCLTSAPGSPSFSLYKCRLAPARLTSTLSLDHDHRVVGHLLVLGLPAGAAPARQNPRIFNVRVSVSTFGASSCIICATNDNLYINHFRASQGTHRRSARINLSTGLPSTDIKYATLRVKA